MLACVNSCAVIGLEGVIVSVEVDTADGLPGVIIVGLPDAAVQESRERVQAAIKNSGLPFPRKRIVVNLAPASVRKEGPTYDLPIALGVLVMSGFLPQAAADGALVIGELSLDDSVRHARGVLPMAAVAREEGFQRVFVPQADAAEAALIPGLEVTPVSSLRDLFNHLTGYSTRHDFRKLLVAPFNLRAGLEKLIRREIEHAKAGREACLIFKANSLVDPAIISLLYEASQAGVCVAVLVRGLCRISRDGMAIMLQLIALLQMLLQD